MERLYIADIQIRAKTEDAFKFADDKYQRVPVTADGRDQAKFKLVAKFPDLKLADAISAGLARVSLTECNDSDFQD